MLRCLIAVIILLCAHDTMAIEKPDYEVIWQGETFEIRRYAPAILAQTAVTGNLSLIHI